MRPSTASRARQILLLCALALAVLGMHHVAPPPQESAHVAMADAPMPVPSSGDTGTGTGHDLLHLCLVVVCAAAVFLLATWPRTTASAPRTRPGNHRRPAVPRAPKAAGRALLAEVCVLRL